MSIARSFAPVLAVAVLALAATAAHAAGDAAKGKKVFNRCKACHTLDAGKHRVGPSLAGVVGREAGSADGFTRYSKGLKNADFVWDEDKLKQYLANPKDMFSDSRMTFKLNKESDREDVIAYLMQAAK